MATFLQMTQKVARESGTIAGVQPAAVTGQTGRLLKVVNWVADAWEEIQNDRESWLWMRKEYLDESVTVSVLNTVRYTPASWNLTDHSRWVTEKDSLTMYLVSTGVSDEGELNYIPWSDFRKIYLRGTQTASRPRDYSISPANEICIGPKPDAVYAFAGEYYQGNQTLAANATAANCPARFHDVIVWKALQKLAASDEAVDLMNYATSMYEPLRKALERDQLPEMNIAGTATLA